MNLFKKYISSLLSKVFGRQVEFSSQVTLYMFITYYTSKALVPVLRGLWYGIFLRKAHWPLFVGEGVKLRFVHLLQAGRSVSLGDQVRINALSSGGVRLGDRVSIREGSIIQLTSHLDKLGESVEIENDVYIGPYAFIGAAAKIRIGARTLIGPKLTIIAEQHEFDGLRSVYHQGVSRVGVTIGQDCWIGANVTILDGVTIGCDCVIGAGAVVTKSIPEGSVAFGVPARVQRTRIQTQDDSPKNLMA